MPSSPGSPASARPRRGSVEPPRPIAAALQLPREHVVAIDASHQRCAAAGLSRFESPDLTPLARADLALARERNLRLHTHAAPVMEMLYEQIVHTQSMVVLCDATGTVIHAIGDDDFLARASKVALAPGANWSEPAKGTNAVGTALIAETPTLVHADEHYVHANHFLTCSAAPILDPRGNILGVLDVSGDKRSYHQHTMALVKMSARMIENHWLSDDFRHLMRLHFHVRPGTIGTLMEGMLAVSPEGRIVGANRSAIDQLGMSGAALRMHTLASLLGTSVGALVDHFRSPLAMPLVLRGPDGRQMHVVARFNWPAWQGIGARPLPVLPVLPAPAPPPAAAAPAPPPALRREGSALAALSAGDAQVDALVERARRVLDRDIPILIVGETGSGKQTLARALHDDSRRALQPFVRFDCAATPPSRIEAELFGAAAGAPPGCVERARGGTLFLDHIDELPLPAQARLLHLLQAGDAAPALVCAARLPLEQRIDAGAFRDDLYYRLAGLTLKLPPLRRRSDLLPLAARMLAALAAAERRAAPTLADEVSAPLLQHRWPGNLRQLYNVLRGALAMAGGAAQLKREHLGEDFFEALSPARKPAAPSPPPPAAAQRSLDDIEIDAIRAALATSGGNVSLAARQLGISRNTIYRKLRWNPASLAAAAAADAAAAVSRRPAAAAPPRRRRAAAR